MRLCRICRKLSPKGACYCIGCGGAFLGKRCNHGHLNPPTALRCGTCGSDQLSAFAPSIAVGWVTLLLSVVVGMILLLGLVAVMPTLLDWIGHGAQQLTHALFGASPSVALMLFISHLIYLAIVLGTLSFVARSLGIPVGPAWKLIRRLIAGLLRVVKWLLRGLDAMVRSHDSRTEEH